MKGVFLVLAIALCGVMADDICTEITHVSTHSTKMMNAQTLESDFIVDIELVDREDSTVTNMRMFYSKQKNIIRLDTLKNQERTSLFFYFEYNEILKFQHGSGLGRGRCDTFQDLNVAVDEFWFGGVQTSKKSPPIPAPLAVMHFTGVSGFSDHLIKQIYLGTTQVRGKTSTMYNSCQKFKSSSNDIVLNVTHYFAEEALQFPYVDSKFSTTKFSTLLSVDMKGHGKVGGVTKTIDHTYNYFNLRGFDENGHTHLETPDAIECADRTATDKKKFPPLPKFIKFTGEVVNTATKMFKSKEEVYDYNYRYAILKQINNLDSKDDMNRQTMLFDFPADTFFVIDEVESTCQHHKISDYPPNPELYRLQKGKSYMDKPSSFFLGDTGKFSYLGQKRIRDMDTDVWVGPSDVFKGATVQFHFAPPTNSWNDKVASFITEKWAVPVKMKIWKNDNDMHPTSENIFHVDYNALRPDYIDTSPCYKYTYHMQVVLKGTKKDITDSYEEAFLYEAKNQMAQMGGMGSHQISQMKVTTVADRMVFDVKTSLAVKGLRYGKNLLKLYYTPNNIFLEFIVGSQHKDILQSATSKISDNLKSGKMKIMIRPPGSLKFTKPLPLVSVNSVNLYAAFSAKKASSSDSGYSTGAMAGLGIGMIIVGLAGGAGAGFAHSKFFG